MKYEMNKNKINTDDYTKLMLYSLAERFVILHEILLPEYNRFISKNNLQLTKLYRFIQRVSKKLAHRLRRTGALVIADAPFAVLRNRLCTLLPYNKKRLLLNLATDLYKVSTFEKLLQEPFCNPELGFDFDLAALKAREIQVQTGDVDMSLITSNKTDRFEQLKKQAENAFKKIETKEDLSLFLEQFFNFEEDINDCFKLSHKEAC